MLEPQEKMGFPVAERLFLQFLQKRSASSPRGSSVNCRERPEIHRNRHVFLSKQHRKAVKSADYRVEWQPSAVGFKSQAVSGCQRTSPGYQLAFNLRL